MPAITPRKPPRSWHYDAARLGTRILRHQWHREHDDERRLVASEDIHAVVIGQEIVSKWLLAVVVEVTGRDPDDILNDFIAETVANDALEGLQP